MIFGDVPYSQKRLDGERATECPACGPTTWIASAAGFLCCGCGQDLEELLPPLCRACGGSGFWSAGGNVIGMGWCSSCNGTGKGPDFRGLKLALDAAREADFKKGVEELQEKMEADE